MAFTFSVDKPGDIQATFRKIKEAVETHGGAIIGDENSGDIKIRGVEGKYIFGTEAIELTVYKKPPYISKKKFEKEVRKMVE